MFCYPCQYRKTDCRFPMLKEIPTRALANTCCCSRSYFVKLFENIFFFVCPFCLIIIFVRTLRVIKADFFDLDVGSVRTVILMPSRKVEAQDRGWTLKKVLRSLFL